MQRGDEDERRRSTETGPPHLLPVLGAISKTINAFADLRAVAEVLAADVAEEVVQVPLHHEGADMIAHDGLATSATRPGNVAHHFGDALRIEV